MCLIVSNISLKVCQQAQIVNKIQIVYIVTIDAKGQSWGFKSRSTARVILGQVLRIATCGTRTHRGDSL